MNARRATGILVLLTLLAATASAAPDLPFTPGWTHVIPLSAGAAELLSDAAQRSPIIGTLLRDLEKSDIVAYVADLTPASTAGGPPSYLSFVSRDLTARYLVIRIDRFKLSPTERVVFLAHELHHALEVAAAPEVKDAATLARLYRKIGRETARNRFESDAAQAVSIRVRNELSSRD